MLWMLWSQYILKFVNDIAEVERETNGLTKDNAAVMVAFKYYQVNNSVPIGMLLKQLWRACNVDTCIACWLRAATGWLRDRWVTCGVSIGLKLGHQVDLRAVAPKYAGHRISPADDMSRMEVRVPIFLGQTCIVCSESHRCLSN